MISRFLSLLVTALAAPVLVLAEEQDADAPAAADIDDSSYVLRPNDVIRLDVYQEADLSGAVRILKTGEASFPLIESVEIAGLTVNAAARKIRDLYARDFLVDPNLTLTVQQYATDYISVIGSVRNAGQIPIPVSGRIDLASAMATAGGLTETADPRRIQLVRESGDTRTFTHDSIVNGSNGRTPLRAGDRIIVNESSFVGETVTILGSVGRQGPVAFPVNGRLDLITALARAGGRTQMAHRSRILINRGGETIELDYREITQRAHEPFMLQPGDVINVPERLF